VGQRERRQEATRMEGTNQKEKCISMRAPTARGPNGPVRKVMACREEWAGIGELGRLGRIPGED
jgi:hypothetical protein